jgi:nucleotide-binding universal stress UspA family protein
MLSLTRILVPVVFSEHCRKIVSSVKLIAAKYAAEVTLFHVVEPFYTIPPTALGGPVMIPISPAVIANREKQMAAFAAEELKGLQVRRLVYEGDPVSEILAFVAREGTHLIAMPTRGHGTLRRFLIGSVTAKVLHDAACPVLTGVHLENATAAGDAGFSNILCAVDLGSQSREVLAWASRIAADFGARLSVMHTIASLEPGMPIGSSPEFRLELETLARNEIEKLQVAVGAESATVHVRGGEPARAICSYAQTIGADLLVIGRGLQDRAGGRLPANAYAIIRQSPAPVISI